MKKSYKFLILILIMLSQFSCSKEEKVTVLKSTNLETQMIDLYNEAYDEFLKGDTSFLFMHGQRYLRNLKFQIVPSTFICEQMTRVIAFHQQTKEVYLPKITDWARHIAL